MQSYQFDELIPTKLSLALSGVQIDNVRIIGPFRTYTQVEISKTDSFSLGLNPPIRDSGDLNGAELITILGPVGTITKNVCIISNRHIHITKEEKDLYGLGDTISIKVPGEKSSVLNQVKFKVDPNCKFELHIDTDDANANLIKTGDELEIIK